MNMTQIVTGTALVVCAVGTTIRRDGLEMIFYSDRPGSVGSFDLWMSTRETTRDAWSTPVNLGSTVNTDAQDRGPALSWDGTTLYFNSDRSIGFGGQDLYATTRTRLVGVPKN
jgi:WD40-like Beta Propeller Repeat